MTAFVLSTGAASLLRRSALLPSAAAVSAFRPAYPAGWPAAAARVRRSAQGVVVARAMADGIKAPGSTNADDAVWREKLSREEYRILRQKGTEMGGTGEYNKFAPVEGFFKCAGCGNPLYSAQSKFDSGCGWPAFDKCYTGSVKTETDFSFGMKRVEIMCNACGGHLGHVFEGESFTATNERHCVNSVSIKFDKGTPPAAPESKVV